MGGEQHRPFRGVSWNAREAGCSSETRTVCFYFGGGPPHHGARVAGIATCAPWARRRAAELTRGAFRLVLPSRGRYGSVVQ